MQITSDTTTNGIQERLFDFDLDGERIPGVVWTPANQTGGRPLLLMGHGGSQHKKFIGITTRAAHYVQTLGVAVAAIDAPNHGERVVSPEFAAFTAALRQQMAEKQPVGRLVAEEMERLSTQAVSEWRAALDGLQTLDGVGANGPVGYWGLAMGGVFGVHLAAEDPRIRAAMIGLTGLFPGQARLAQAASRVQIPLQFVIQWHDELAPRDAAFALFDALASTEKTLHANPGGHGRLPAWEEESAEHFFDRHLSRRNL